MSGVMEEDRPVILVTGGASGIGLAIASAALTFDWNIGLPSREGARPDTVGAGPAGADRVVALPCSAAPREDGAMTRAVILTGRGSFMMEAAAGA